MMYLSYEHYLEIFKGKTVKYRTEYGGILYLKVKDINVDKYGGFSLIVEPYNYMYDFDE